MNSSGSRGRMPYAAHARGRHAEADAHCGAGGLVVVAAAGPVVLWPRPDRITKESFLLIQLGASRSQVGEILGHPGDHRSAPTEPKTVREAVSIEDRYPSEHGYRPAKHLRAAARFLGPRSSLC
jgi:hypothetical protein